jgi:membrane protease YdiL (CAAX protease family)
VIERLRLTQGDYLPDAEWSYPDTLYVFLAGQATAVLAAVVVLAGDASPFASVATVLVAQTVGALGLAAALSARRGTGDWGRDFGLRIYPRHVWGIAVGFALQLVAALIIGPLVQLLAPDDPPQQNIVEIGEDISGGFESLVFLFLVVILAPLVEEVIFRGMLLSRLRRSMGPWPAILISAAVFSAIHLTDPDAILAIPSLFVVGVALGWVALRQGDLSLAIFVHAGVNLTGAIALLFGEELTNTVEAVLRFI